MRILPVSFLLGLWISVCCPAQSNADHVQSGLDLLQIAPQLRSASGFLGIAIIDLDSDRARKASLSEERGVEVIRVEENSPADAAGIKQGDILLAYNGENILGAQQFVRLVSETPRGRKVKIQLWRERKTQTVLATIEAPRMRDFSVPANFTKFDMPREWANSIRMADIPNPVLVWKNQMLGLDFEPLTPQLAQYFGVKGGLLVRSVDPGSASDKAGIKAGDIISAAGGQPLLSSHDLNTYFRSHHDANQSLAVTVMRDHKQLTMNVSSSLAPDPSSR